MNSPGNIIKSPSTIWLILFVLVLSIVVVFVLHIQDACPILPYKSTFALYSRQYSSDLYRENVLNKNHCHDVLPLIRESANLHIQEHNHRPGSFSVTNIIVESKDFHICHANIASSYQHVTHVNIIRCSQTN